jgi:hypothetical protein
MPNVFAPGPSQPADAPLFAVRRCSTLRSSGRFYSMARGSATECAAILDLLHRCPYPATQSGQFWFVTGRSRCSSCYLFVLKRVASGGA